MFSMLVKFENNIEILPSYVCVYDEIEKVREIYSIHFRVCFGVVTHKCSFKM